MVVHASLEGQKRRLRKELRQELALLSPAERKLESEAVLKKLVSHPRFKKAKSILSYIALESEVETGPVIEAARADGKRVYAPLIDQKRGGIQMIEIEGLEGLRPGSYGILEPAYDPKRIGDPKDLELALIPGLGFDREGGRLGRGKGYFDRFLKSAQQAYKIALAFRCQVVDRIPRGPMDETVDEVVIG